MDVGSITYSDDSDDEMMDAENANRGGSNHCKLGKIKLPKSLIR